MIPDLRNRIAKLEKENAILRDKLKKYEEKEQSPEPVLLRVPDLIEPIMPAPVPEKTKAVKPKASPPVAAPEALSVDKMHLVAQKQAQMLGYPIALLRSWKQSRQPPGIRYGKRSFKFSVPAMIEKLKKLVVPEVEVQRPAQGPPTVAEPGREGKTKPSGIKYLPQNRN